MVQFELPVFHQNPNIPPKIPITPKKKPVWDPSTPGICMIHGYFRLVRKIHNTRTKAYMHMCVCVCVCVLRWNGNRVRRWRFAMNLDLMLEWFFAYKEVRLFKLAKVEGMGPWNELLERSKWSSFVKFPSSTGNGPEMLLFCSILLTKVPNHQKKNTKV
jgi:hypothetical protein